MGDRMNMEDQEREVAFATSTGTTGSMEDDDDQESVRTLDEEMDNASSEGAARLIKSPTASNSNAGNGTFADQL
jgi:hypothetical protein